MADIKFALIKDGVVDNIIVAPEGYELEGATVVASEAAQKGQFWDGETFSDPPAPPITTGQVNAERQRRILLGITINGIYVTGDDVNRANLSDLAFGASLRVGSGDVTTITTYRDGNNVDHDLTPPELLSLWQHAAAQVSLLYGKSWALKAMDPLPADFADDSYWSAE